MNLRSLPGVLLILSLLALAPTLMNCGGALLPGQSTLALNNTAPVARITGSGQAPVGGQLGLDGTESYDPDGDEIKYQWSVDTRPEDSVIGENPFSANDDRNASLVTVTLDVEGVYIFALVVVDTSSVASATDYAIFEATSGVELPIADAGQNVTGLEGAEVCLDGSNSHDPSGLELGFSWSLVSVPEDSLVTTADLLGADSVEVCFTPDGAGSYAVALAVNNGLIDSEPDFAFVAVGSTNQGPEAAADVISAASCDFIVLSGATSTDPEGDALYYNWDVLAVPPMSTTLLGQEAFDDPFAEEARFYADVEGEYTVQLVVNDGEDYSTPVFLDVAVVMTTTNAPPVVGTSPDVYYFSPSPTCSVDSYGNCTNCPNCGSVVVPMDALDSTDPDGDLLTITWDLLSGPANTTLEFEEGWLNEMTMPGPPGSCSSTTYTHQAQVQVTATDCVGDTATGLITVVYDCG